MGTAKNAGEGVQATIEDVLGNEKRGSRREHSRGVHIGSRKTFQGYRSVTVGWPKINVCKIGFC